MKVKNYPYQIGSTIYPIELHYNGKTELFTLKNLPDDFDIYAPYWKENISRLTSENNLRTVLIESVKQYVKNKETSRKVIIFNCGASSQITQNYGEPIVEKGVVRILSNGCKEQFSKMVDCMMGYDYAVGFNFYVCTEKDNAGIKEYYKHILDKNLNETDIVETYSRINNTTIKSKNYTVIDFTPEALEFFRSLSNSFTNMANQMSKFFGETDVQKQLEFIKNQKLIG